MTLPLTITIAVLLGVLAVPLSIYVTLNRVRVGKEAGELTAAAFGPHPDIKLTAALRAHGNFSEYVPLALVMIGLAEIYGAQGFWLWIIGLAFVAGRYLHAFAMLTNPYPPALRGLSMFTTYAVIIGPTIYLAVQLI